MNTLNAIWTFANDNAATIFGGLFLLSEALAQIPAVKANSVFQLVFGFLSKYKQPAVPVVLFAALLLTAGCGKTLAQIQQTAHTLIDVAGKVYEDTVDNTKAVKDAVTPATK